MTPEVDQIRRVCGARGGEVRHLETGEKLSQGKEISHWDFKNCVYFLVNDLTFSQSLQAMFSKSQC